MDNQMNYYEYHCPHCGTGPLNYNPETASNQMNESIADFAGTWYLRGDRKKPYHIKLYGQDFDRVIIVNESGKSYLGHFEDDTLVLDPPAPPIQGMISSDGSRIAWSNGEFWKKSR